MPGVEALVHEALQAAGQARWQRAEQLWHQVLQQEPRHPRALFSLGMHAFQSHRNQEALTLLQRAHESLPDDPMILVMLARVHREVGKGDQELKALDAALAADPYCMPALLAKGEYFEARAQRRQAAKHYGNALRIAPPESEWSAGLKERLDHARSVQDEVSRGFAEFLEREIGQRAGELTQQEMERWREAGAIMSGRTQPYHAVCNRMHIPRLPAVPFFPREMFPWLAAIEARTAEIAEEWRAIWNSERKEFGPYVAYAPGTPVNQWQELNHSPRWSSYFLWKDGKPVQPHLESCPVTAQALALSDAADIPGQCPNAMFSVLAPHTHIPPHHGETNARTLVHLPLIVPPGCSYRVGYEWRRWHVGEALIFDDTIEHEARNDSDEIRVVLIFEIWNPMLSQAERDMARVLTALEHQYRA